MVLRRILAHANWNSYLKRHLMAKVKTILRHLASYLNPFRLPADAVIIVSSLFQPILVSERMMPVVSSSELTD